MKSNRRRSLQLVLKSCCDSEEPPPCPCDCEKPKSFLPFLPNILGFLKGNTCHCNPGGREACLRRKKEQQKLTPPKPSNAGLRNVPLEHRFDHLCDRHRGLNKKPPEVKQEPPKQKPVSKLPSVLDILDKDNGCYCGIVANAMCSMSLHPLTGEPFRKEPDTKCCSSKKITQI